MLKVFLRKIIRLLTVTSLLTTAAFSQPDLGDSGRLPWPDLSLVSPQVAVTCEWISAESIVLYQYTLTSLATSQQNLCVFDIPSDIEPVRNESPWSVGIYLNAHKLRRGSLSPRMSWMPGSRAEMLRPGETIGDFKMGVAALPGVSECNASGWVEPLVVEEVPPEMRPEGLMPLERMFAVEPTVGPIFPLEQAEANVSSLGAFLVTESEKAQELGWLDSSLGIPGKLQSLQSALVAGDTSLSGQRIAELQTLLNQHLSQGVSSDGLALLQPSLAFLASKFPPSDPVDQIVFAAGDATVYERGPHVNEGANPRLALKKVTGKPAHFAVAFDLDGVDIDAVTRATLVLSIDPSQNVTGWGNGRTIRAQRLTTAWTEGNAKALDLPNSQRVLGSGEGVTWFSPIDTNIANTVANSTVSWAGGLNYTNPGTAPPVTITNHASGQIAFDVTDDVLAGAENGWLITRDDLGSQVAFFSREGAAAASDNTLAPHLVLEFDGPSAQASPSLLHRLLGLVELAWERISGAQVGEISSSIPRG